jgi:hypothetical protein
MSHASRSKFRFPVHHYSRGSDCILLFLLTHERDARTAPSTFARGRIATLRSACDRGKDSIGHVEDTASSRLAELTSRQAHPRRNTDLQVCAPSGENPRWAHRPQACVPIAHCNMSGKNSTELNQRSSGFEPSVNRPAVD